MAFTVVLPIAVRPLNDQRSTGPIAVPAGVVGADFRLDRTAGDVWQAGDSVDCAIDVSYDGGTTWARAVATSFVGPLPATNRRGDGPFEAIVGTNFAPDAQGRAPTHGRAGYLVTGGSPAFGVSRQVDRT